MNSKHMIAAFCAAGLAFGALADDTKSAEAEACIEEWGELLEVAYEKYENDEVKMKEFLAGGDSYKCE